MLNLSGLGKRGDDDAILFEGTAQVTGDGNRPDGIAVDAECVWAY